MAKSIPEDEWGEWWDVRVAAIETVLGPCHDIVGHAAIPFDIGIFAVCLNLSITK